MRKNKMILLFRSFLLLCFLVLLGCQVEEPWSNEEGVKEMKVDPVIALEPLDTVRLHKSVARIHWIRSDPFKPSSPNNHNTPIQSKKIAENSVGFKLVGVIEKNAQNWALILLPSGKLIKVAEGDYLEPFRCQIRWITHNGIGIIQHGHERQLLFTRSPTYQSA